MRSLLSNLADSMINQAKIFVVFFACTGAISFADNGGPQVICTQQCGPAVVTNGAIGEFYCGGTCEKDCECKSTATPLGEGVYSYACNCELIPFNPI